MPRAVATSPRPLVAALLAVLMMAAAAHGDDLVKQAEDARIRTIQQVYGSVVAVYGMQPHGGGSGVLYDPAGYALTNYHVVRAAGQQGKAGLADGQLYPWKLVGLDPGGDVAVIKLEGQPRFPFSRLGNSDSVRVGDLVMAMGNPFALAEDHTPTVTLGMVSGVKRYQPGTGPTGTLLVYGNCIQTDSSINPGNSGGPLFNLRGDIIGINGRGSFEERGRVNVGVGFAISINQIKLFLPDLLATKIAQHGTLDATFGDRGDRAVCISINRDGQAAKNGLDLGDRLVSFDGVPIVAANQYASLISTLPAGWPVEVVFERDGQQRRFWQRLDALPYPKPPPRPAPKAPAKPEAKKDTEATKDRAKPAVPGPQGKPAEPGEQAKKLVPVPVRALSPVEPPMGEPGKIRDEKLNRLQAERVIAAWNRFKGDPGAVKAIRLQYRAAGTSDQPVRDAVWEVGGRLRVTGQAAWEEMVGPASPLQPTRPAELKSLVLQGSDKSQNQPCYRLLVELPGGRRLLLWLSVLDESGGGFQVRLLKSAAADKDGKESTTAVLYRDYRRLGALMVPTRRTVVQGLSETVLSDDAATNLEPLAELPKEANDG